LSSASVIDSDCLPTVHPGVYASVLDDDRVLYDARVGQGFILNATGAHIWSLCDGTRTVAAIAEEIVTTYQIAYDQALADVWELVGELETAGLLSNS
jgi:hypothetical protein